MFYSYFWPLADLKEVIERYIFDLEMIKLEFYNVEM